MQELGGQGLTGSTVDNGLQSAILNVSNVAYGIRELEGA